MKNNPLISVVMSVYNAEKYVANAIKSILKQTFKNFEFIIINDGSSDKSLTIIKSFKKTDNRIKIINNKINLGLIKSLNSGLKIARGRYIARMDADDISLPQRFEEQKNYLEEHPEIFLISGSFHWINERDEIIDTRINSYNALEVKKKLPYPGIIIHHPTVMFRNSGQIFYREKAIYCEDQDLWLRLVSEGKNLVVLPHLVLKYRIHGNSVCNTNGEKQRLFMKQVKKWYFERLKYGKDGYDLFNPQEILSLPERSLKGNELVKSRKIKIFFKNNNDMQEVRNMIKEYWKVEGMISWKIGLAYYFLSFMPLFLINSARKLIWKDNFPNTQKHLENSYSSLSHIRHRN